MHSCPPAARPHAWICIVFPSASRPRARRNMTCLLARAVALYCCTLTRRKPPTFTFKFRVSLPKRRRRLTNEGLSDRRRRSTRDKARPRNSRTARDRFHPQGTPAHRTTGPVAHITPAPSGEVGGFTRRPGHARNRRGFVDGPGLRSPDRKSRPSSSSTRPRRRDAPTLPARLRDTKRIKLREMRETHISTC